MWEWIQMHLSVVKKIHMSVNIVANLHAFEQQWSFMAQSIEALVTNSRLMIQSIITSY